MLLVRSVEMNVLAGTPTAAGGRSWPTPSADGRRPPGNARFSGENHLLKKGHELSSAP